MQFNFLAATALLIFSLNTQAATTTECANHAKSAAIRTYINEVGTVQGSEGIQYEIKEKLKAKLPFHNYIVSISDNNEDGEYWTVDYFVMTKKVGDKCQVLKVQRQDDSQTSQTESGALKITSYKDFVNDELEAPIEVEVTVAFVNDADKYIDFRVFTDEDTYPSMCYVGTKEGAADVINSILDVSTGDSAILTSKVTFKGDTIAHKGTYTEGSGDYDFPLNFEVKKCN